MKLISLTFLLFASYRTAYAGSVDIGGPCSTGNNRLQTGTYQFWSECNSVSYCSDEGVCVAKGCRKDDFPFGYAQGDPNLPPKCGKGEFCPDEGTECQPVLSVNSPCQLNRDDQCEGPDNFKELADTSGRGLNFNGSVCLNNVCMWANVTLGNKCVVENTPYIAYGASGEFIDIVSRGNCKLGLYCDSSSLVCMNNKLLGESCEADKECDSWNCLSSGVCGVTAATPHHFGVYVYILVALGIIGGMSGTLTGLYFAHRKQRERERAKRAQYWREQNAFHQNLMQMRETARASILNLRTTSGGRNDYTLSRDASDESNSALHTSGPKASGLRNYMGDDSDIDDGLIMHSGKNDGRF
ncbi:hypothetical protein JR316_0002264 [Psilocybe cubensis]|uniref:Uncharacterized protein n=2 Tax=Psilocybe cubensis TaxID=181762 RepID=A0ACB8HBX2_PSICU|nr:hypothetical protein JR316_0002264 [Psilocybe cubensis]KAH9485356.1 hypothetical protein JR316_0002264 [Psilocybe cubensis]